MKGYAQHKNHTTLFLLDNYRLIQAFKHVDHRDRDDLYILRANFPGSQPDFPLDSSGISCSRTLIFNAVSTDLFCPQAHAASNLSNRAAKVFVFAAADPISAKKRTAERVGRFSCSAS
ncbi:hypothetical protein LAD77_00915 [Klebsiella pneumoniae]|nr:hypothetical protein [Klebsiella pneumoniae]